MTAVRLFVGSTFDAAAMARVVDAQRRARSIAEHEGWRATWVAPENLHTTVKFLGDVDDAKIPALADVLARVASAHEPIRLELTGVDAFPPRRPPRVLFVAAKVIAGDLVSLARNVDVEVANFDVPRDTRPFRGHLTLARVRFVPRGQALETFAAKLEPMLAGPARIESITLYRSELLPNGPRYHVLGTYSLGT